MLAEYPETDPLFLGPDRLGRMCGRSGRWIRHRESEGVIERAILNGEGPAGRPVYDADQTLPKLVAFLAARKGPSPEAQQVATQRVEAGRAKAGNGRDRTGQAKRRSCHKGLGSGNYGRPYR
jgi:hypothetical protein